MLSSLSVVRRGVKSAIITSRSCGKPLFLLPTLLGERWKPFPSRGFLNQSGDSKWSPFGKKSVHKEEEGWSSSRPRGPDEWHYPHEVHDRSFPPPHKTVKYDGPLHWFYESFHRHVVPISGNQDYNNPWPVMLSLTAMNLAVFVLWLTAFVEDALEQQNAQQNKMVVDRASLFEHQQWMTDNFTVCYNNLADGRVHTLMTAAISHADFGHLAGNMFAMWLFGFKTVKLIGARNFVGLYVAGGLACSVAHVLHNVWLGRKGRAPSVAETAQLNLENEWDRKRLNKMLEGADIPSLGASGSVMAISAASMMLFPLDRILYRFIFIPLPVAVGMYFVSDLIGITTMNSSSGVSVDHVGHVAGVGMGAAYILYLWYGVKKGRIRADIPLVARFRTGNWNSHLDPRSSQYYKRRM